MLLTSTIQLFRRASYQFEAIQKLSSCIQIHQQSPTHIKLKPPKGMRDIGPGQAWERKRIIKIVTDCFELHGAQPLESPVCEKREVLAGEYGEESKLIYNLKDQDEEALSLRYDLTVPFARYLAQNRIQAMTRYQIGKVYRREDPAMTRGKFREFYQCDLDFAGKFDTMMADVECLVILCEILEALKLPYDFNIKINHRSILNGMLKIAGVPQDKFKAICTSIDRLEKLGWDGVKKEMCVEKGLDEKVADKIGKHVCNPKAHMQLDDLLQSDFGQHEDVKVGLEELDVLYKYADQMGICDRLKFDMSLARGLDYYTGLIFEAVIQGEVEVGSIAAGGRYDNLVSNLVGTSDFNVPCVGLSIGLERLFVILDSQPTTKAESQLCNLQVHCCIGSIGKGMSDYRYRIVRDLRASGIRVKNILKDYIQPVRLYDTCEKLNAPFAIFFGPDDIKNDLVRVRTLSTRTDANVPLNDLAGYLDKLLKQKSLRFQEKTNR